MRRTVSIEKARELSNAGEWHPNPRHNPRRPDSHPTASTPQFFHATYSILWRPDPTLPERQQFALVEEV